jgi:hypothetical protein
MLLHDDGSLGLDTPTIEDRVRFSDACELDAALEALASLSCRWLDASERRAGRTVWPCESAGRIYRRHLSANRDLIG